MESRIIYEKSSAADNLYSWVFDILPDSVARSLGRADRKISDGVSEIRLHSDGISTATVCGCNLIISENGIEKTASNPLRLTEKDIDSFIYKACRGSVYSYESSIAQGFITVKGVRIGISGDVIQKDGTLGGFSKIRSVNIRLPRHINGCADNLLSHISAQGFDNTGGILVASAPGVGKTTVLRELAIKLSGGISDAYGRKRIYRVSVIDERCELYIPSLFTECCADVFSGVSKHKGIELASRAMSPEVIIFDEIGSESDAKAVMSAHFGGIAFISSLHADCPESVRNKRIIRELSDAGIFTRIYFLQRTEHGIRGTIHKVKP